MDWKEFEKDTAEIFKDAGCKVEIGIKISGVRGDHDIDVYVTFEKFGIECIWVVECKNWNSNIPKEKVHALRDIVNDIGADRGVLISKQGFQSGAIKSARNSNITLTSLEDLKEYLKEEIEQKEIDFLEKLVLKLKYKILNLYSTKTTGANSFISSLPEGIDGSKTLELGGKLSILEMGFTHIKIGQHKLPMRFDEEGNKIITTDSIPEFLALVKRQIVEVTSWLESIKGLKK